MTPNCGCNFIGWLGLIAIVLALLWMV